MGKCEWGALKKLIGAARYWAVAGQPKAKPLALDEGVAEGLRRMGVSESDIAAQQAGQAAPEDEDFEVHADCWESVIFFLTVQTQWVFRGFGMGSVRAALNYPGVESGARMAGIRRAQWPALFADLRVMELAVLTADGKQAQAQE